MEEGRLIMEPGLCPGGCA